MSWQWTPDTTANLVKFWGAGLSAGQVAQKLGRAAPESVSRNAVLGKLHRLGLLKRKAAANPRGVNDFHKIARTSRSRGAYAGGAGFRPSLPPQPFTPSDIVVESPTPLAFLDMPNHGRCRWPLDTEPFTFCGNASPGTVYCKGHHAIANDAARTEDANRRSGIKPRAGGVR
jgi:GcrA cell cycle regulator